MEAGGGLPFNGPCGGAGTGAAAGTGAPIEETGVRNPARCFLGIFLQRACKLAFLKKSKKWFFQEFIFFIPITIEKGVGGGGQKPPLIFLRSPANLYAVGTQQMYISNPKECNA